MNRLVYSPSNPNTMNRIVYVVNSTKIDTHTCYVGQDEVDALSPEYQRRIDLLDAAADNDGVAHIVNVGARRRGSIWCAEYILIDENWSERLSVGDAVSFVFGQ